MDERLRETTVNLEVDLVKECEQHLKFIHKQQRRISQKKSSLDRLRAKCNHEIVVHIGDVGPLVPINICLFCELARNKEEVQDVKVIEAPHELWLSDEAYNHIEELRKEYIKKLTKTPDITLDEMVSHLKNI